MRTALKWKLKRDQYAYGMLILDWEGSGSTEESPIFLETVLDDQLNRTWGKGAKSIVIEPELESWVWGSDNSMREALRWEAASGIRDWLSAPYTKSRVDSSEMVWPLWMRKLAVEADLETGT